MSVLRKTVFLSVALMVFSLKEMFSGEVSVWNLGLRSRPASVLFIQH